MKKIAIILFIMILFIICITTPELSTAKEGGSDSECINCHTNLKKLIRLSWEIEKIRPKPAESAETSGEG